MYRDHGSFSKANVIFKNMIDSNLENCIEENVGSQLYHATIYHHSKIWRQ